MTSPIFDTLTAEREATPVFESLTPVDDDPLRPFGSASPTPTPSPIPTPHPFPASVRDALTAVATWPLRSVPS